VRGDGDRDGRLTDTARAVERDETALFEQLRDRDDVTLAPDHIGNRTRGVFDAGFYRCSGGGPNLLLNNGGDEAIAAPSDVGDIAGVIVSIAERSS
jgi:hypothetical protein